LGDVSQFHRTSRKTGGDGLEKVEYLEEEARMRRESEEEMEHRGGRGV